LNWDAINIFGPSLLLVIVVCAVIVHRDRIRSGQMDPLNPGLLFVFYYVIYNFIAYLRHWDFEIPGAELYAELALLGLTGVVLGTVLAHASQPRNPVMLHSRIVPVRPVLLASLAVMVLSLVMIVVMYTRGSSLSGLLAGEASDKADLREGVLSGASCLLPMVAAVWLVALLRARGKLRYAFIAALGAMFAAYFALFARRGEILATGFGALYLFHYNIRRVRVGVLVLAFVAIYVSLQITSVARAGMDGGVEGMVEVVEEADLKEFMSNLDHLEPYNHMLRGMELVTDGPPENTPLMGSSYSDIILQVPPQSLCPWERPEALSVWYARMYTPEVHARGGAWGFPPLVEAYFNFGHIGPLVVFAALAFAINSIHLRACRTARGSVMRFANCLLAAVLYQFMRNTVGGVIKVRVVGGIVPAMLMVWACVQFSGRSGRADWSQPAAADGKRTDQ